MLLLLKFSVHPAAATPQSQTCWKSHSFLAISGAVPSSQTLAHTELLSFLMCSLVTKPARAGNKKKFNGKKALITQL